MTGRDKTRDQRPGHSRENGNPVVPVLCRPMCSWGVSEPQIYTRRRPKPWRRLSIAATTGFPLAQERRCRGGCKSPCANSTSHAQNKTRAPALSTLINHQRGPQPTFPQPNHTRLPPERHMLIKGPQSDQKHNSSSRRYPKNEETNPIPCKSKWLGNLGGHRRPRLYVRQSGTTSNRKGADSRRPPGRSI